MNDLELGLREAALRDGSRALSILLNEIPDFYEGDISCDICSSSMDNIGRREKSITSLLGEGTLKRSYFKCSDPNCSGHRYPKDELLDIQRTSFSPGIRRLMAKAGSNDAFDRGRIDIEEYSGIKVDTKDVERISEKIGNEIEVWQEKERENIFSREIPILPIKTIPVMYIEFDGTGIPVISEEVKGRKGKQADGSAKTREVKTGCVFTQTTRDEKGRPIRDPGSTTYVAKIETAEEFGKRIESEAIRRGMWNSKTVVVLGDGAVWIRNLVEQHFCGAIHIVDFYHAKEHLHKLLQFLYPNQEKMDEQLPIWLKWFEAGEIEKIVETAKQACLTLTEKAFDDAKKEIGYFEENVNRMRYAKYKDLGLFIGSGVIEAACKNVIGKRLKQSGMRWSVKGADDIIALRCSIQSARFDEYWESRCAI
jgi:hypothetical protein